MDVYRSHPLPAIYTELRFVRKSPFACVDCDDDYPIIQQLQRVVKGDTCVSELEALISCS